ncbi:MAG: poly(R)-hydroxyalkanoic acid synthase subunit PhaE [Candidatus Thermoplasmatota archaeon]
MADEPKGDKDDEAVGELFREMWKYQMEMFKGFFVAPPGYSQEMLRILRAHWDRVEKKLGELHQDLGGGSETLQKHKDLYLYCMQSYSQMLQEFLVSPTFLNALRDTLNTGLTQKIQGDEVREEILKAWGLPTRRDVHEIYYNLYIINRKLDKISEALEQTEEGR